jgi:uncharacterized repeat protein (TIGR01451 family)
MKNRRLLSLLLIIGLIIPIGLGAGAIAANPQTVILYQPYIQPGDASSFGTQDQMVIAWQTNETQPHPSNYKVEFGTNRKSNTVVPTGRVVDNYLATDPALPVPPTATGPRTNYYALLPKLQYNTNYTYKVTGLGLPAAGFQSTFHTRKQTSLFSFQVMGDEGFFPADPNNKPNLANYEARVVNTMYNVEHLSFPGLKLPKPDLALNTGDNVYLTGSEANYNDFWMPVWNNDTASNETGAPYVRSIPYYIVAGNHDLGGSGDRANLLADDSAGRYSGKLDGGDALQYFNNYYFPLNGPPGVDMQYVFNGDSVNADGFYFKYKNQTYESPQAIAAFRDSTKVNTGQGEKRQIDHMSNYSFDYGNAHFTFLDANPHLFNAIVTYDPVFKSPPTNFPEYPSLLRDWLINDLDSSNQPWKIVVYHQAAFSSGNATLRNNQMRRIARFLEDHGVNLVYNGHEHNYQRTLPLHALSPVAENPTSTPAVAIDTKFDGRSVTVPDGVIYVVEGAGGDRDFDNNLQEPRGQGASVDQEDSASGNFTDTKNNLTFPNGPDSWLDTHLTTAQMSAFFPNAGKGSKITARFKAKVFSFGDVVINGNKLTHYQISEPLLNKSSATAQNPYPYGKDVTGKPLNDPIPETLVDPATGKVITPPAQGTPALMDEFTITKPNVSDRLVVKPDVRVEKGQILKYLFTITNNSPYVLNGTQIVLNLPAGVNIQPNPSSTQHGQEVLYTLGHLEKGKQQRVVIQAKFAQNTSLRKLFGNVVLRSSTAMPVKIKI